ncbi:ATP-dependent zinc metalloprotease FtsH [Desulfosporosinus sp. BICA1-9]|uniref:ATP-dependent zinc metalloprotease FtsH n=1 Tax=Desulfosporosinus sp. BICA1-9 TaxID=1531958 RepID=UPI00054BE10B|nr:ATP-dependent zinc metalloprotease FtsH [Desulfosporosinus sp. BICA1-9]KJS47572.1 MAG: cell division protein FtsH [Peptococcaceae bacterium BRH_c23]KJS89946.1 MAG: cell division protein FtsH [Desulfosporosinus sp. BICA1-9]HBW35567.1 ATP-dependent metallopeptidase FtsH/Yme1/Tma family protein [Desulfosporosinus sp.]
MKVFKNAAIYLLIILMAIMLIKWSTPPVSKEIGMDYNAFKKAVVEDQVKSVVGVVEDNSTKYTVTMKDDKKHEVVGLANDQQLATDLYSRGINFVVEPPPKSPWWVGLLTTMLPIIIIVGLFFFMMQQSQGGGNRVMQFGKSKARLVGEDKKKVTFADVAGADEVKEELEEVVEFLKQPKKFHELGAKIPTGVLLFGPPGTGKTLLARAVSGEAGVPFFSISGSDFVEMFVGVGASRVRDLFEQAKKNAPCIVFIDEIDAVGRQRGAGLGGGHDEREQTLNQLLVEMDGFNGNDGVIIIAATNRADVLDPALLRPGRFDRQVVVDVPDVKGREEILKVHAKGKPMTTDVDLQVIARQTSGFTGADLSNLLNEAALLSARRNETQIRQQALEDSIERVIAGPEKKSRVISPFERKLVSYHEAGHALLGELLAHTDPLHKVSIIPRGRAGGYTLLLPKEDRNYMTKSQLLDQVTMLLGGRVSEALVLHEISTGASNDLERATGIVRKMITELGMSEELGPLTFGHKEEQVFLGRDISRDRSYSDAVAYSIDKEARRIIDECYQNAQNLIQQNIDKLHAIAEALMEKETLDVKDFAALMEKFVVNVEAVEGREVSISLEKGSPLEIAEKSGSQDSDLPSQTVDIELDKK